MYSVIDKMLQVFIGSLLAGIHLFWHIPFLIFACLGFPKWVISDIKQIDIALKKIDDGNDLSSQLRWHHGRIKNDGLIFSWKLGIIGFLYDKTEGNHVVSEMAVIARKKYFDILISSTEAEAFSLLKHPKNTMDSLVAEGSHWFKCHLPWPISFNRLNNLMWSVSEYFFSLLIMLITRCIIKISSSPPTAPFLCDDTSMGTGI